MMFYYCIIMFCFIFVIAYSWWVVRETNKDFNEIRKELATFQRLIQEVRQPLKDYIEELDRNH